MVLVGGAPAAITSVPRGMVTPPHSLIEKHLATPAFRWGATGQRLSKGKQTQQTPPQQPPPNGK